NHVDTIRLATPEVREDGPRVRRAVVVLPGSDIGIVSLSEAGDDALHHVVEVAPARVGGAADLLHTPTQRLPGADHVLVDVGDDVRALPGVLGEVLVLGINFGGPPEADVAL